MAIDILKAFSEEPTPIDFVLPGLVAGTVGGIVSPGGAGKSMLAMELMILVATGNDITGLANSRAFATGKVVYLAAEDPAIALQHRLHSIGKHLTPSVREKMAQNAVIEPLLGHLPNLMNQKWLDAIQRVSEGSRIVILDTLRRFHLADENDSGQMSEVVGRMEAISAKNGNATVFLHHSSKSAAMNGQGDMQQASRGSSVLVDNIRWQMFLSGMTKDEAKKLNVDEDMRGFFVRAGVSKQNYGAPFPEVWLRRGEGGVLVPAEFSTSAVTKKGKKREEV